MSEPVIQTEELTKRYGRSLAVDALNLTVEHGEVFGLLGPNGSGKTTTILMSLGLTEPTSGRVRVLGLDPTRKPLSIKARVGYLPDQIGFYDGLTARENLNFIAKLNGLSSSEANTRIDGALKQMGLLHVANQHVKTFSRGMRQRLGIAEILLKRPEIIIMDEPTLGLDPEAAHMVLGIIHDLKSTGITILLASHLLQQVQEVCDRVGLFSHGKLLLEGRVPDLAEKVLGGAYRIHVELENGHQTIEPLLMGIPGIVNVHNGEHGFYELEATADLRTEVAEKLINNGIKLKTLDMELPTLDEVYAKYYEEAQNVA